jgi:excisionase family DNA binding protein
MTKQLLTIREAAQRLGLREKTLRRWVALRKIEYVKAGERSVRIRQQKLTESSE